MKTREHPLYMTHAAMKQRCYNSNNKGYMHYGGRGISVCERWLGKDGFVNFLEDMGEREEGLTLDRIDNNGNYEPGNCRWATWSDQCKNKRSLPRKKVNTINKSGTTGVCWHKDRSRWYVYIKNTYVGCFVSKDEAIIARREAEVIAYA